MGLITNFFWLAVCVAVLVVSCDGSTFTVLDSHINYFEGELDKKPAYAALTSDAEKKEFKFEYWTMDNWLLRGSFRATEEEEFKFNINGKDHSAHVNQYFGVVYHIRSKTDEYQEYWFNFDDFNKVLRVNDHQVILKPIDSNKYNSAKGLSKTHSESKTAAGSKPAGPGRRSSTRGRNSNVGGNAVRSESKRRESRTRLTESRTRRGTTAGSGNQTIKRITAPH